MNRNNQPSGANLGHKGMNPADLSADQFAHLGDGKIAYIRPVMSDDVARLFPQAPEIQPGLQLFVLSGADGTPIMLTDSRDAALANAWEHELQPLMLH